MAHFKDSSLLELADQISSQAKAIHDYLEKKKLDQPSLAKENSRLEYLEKGDGGIQQVRQELVSAARQLAALAAGPVNLLTERVAATIHDANIMRLIWTWNIPKHVPTDGSISYKELSQKTGFEEGKLTRVLHHAMLNFVFIEPQPGYVAHSSVSRLMLNDTAWAWTGHVIDDSHGAIHRMPEAYQKWGTETQSLTETGFQLYLDTTDNFFDYFSKSAPARLERFGGCMQFAADMTMPALFHWDWTQLGTATLIDLGGSFGGKSFALARAVPGLTCIVQDLPDCIAKKPPAPPDVAARVHFEAHDFFTPQKRTDADAVLIARVFHDWPDADCHRILQNLIPAMKPGCRLIINEFIKRPPYSAPTADQMLAGIYDMHMMALFNNKERSLDEWKALVSTGSEGQLEYQWNTSQLIGFIKK